MMAIKILLADDQTILREGLRSIIETEMHMTVIGQAENGRMAVEMAKKLKPDIIIMDISMPDMNGIDATRTLVADKPGTKVIALSVHNDIGYVSEMMKAGASGYLLKDCALDELARAIKTVLNGKRYVSPDVTGTLLDDYVGSLEKLKEMKGPELSPKEREILQLLAEGKTIKEIAGILNIAVPTVETHKLRMMEKLNLHSVAELTKYAVKIGLTSLE